MKKKSLLPLLILLAGIGITVTIAYYLVRDMEAVKRIEYHLVCNEIGTKIHTRLHSHAQLLRSGSALFSATDTVTRDNWKTFIENSKIEKNLPGIQGVGFACIISKEQLQEHIEHIKKEGFSTYSVSPNFARDVYTSIVYIEPFNFRNQRAFGYDMFSEPVRRKAMEQARDNDVVSLSGKVLLKQETETDLQAGVLMYVPIYSKNKSVNTVEERRSAIIGWVYSPYRMNDLMKGILESRSNEIENKITLCVYDDSISNQSLLFASQRDKLLIDTNSSERIFNIPIEFNGKKWLLRFRQPNNQNPYLYSKVLGELASGIVISFLVYFLILILLTLRKRAQNLAEKLTSDLKESSTKHEELSDLLESIIDHVPGLLFYKDKENRFIRVNKYIALAHGKEKSEMEGKNLNEFYTKEEAEKYFQSDLSVINSGVAQLDIEETWSTMFGVKWLNTNKIPFRNSAGEIIGVIGISMDISDRKKAEELIIKQNNELIKLNADKDRFIFILAHDLKGPFNNVISMLNILEENIRNHDTDDIEKHINMVSVSAVKVYNLLEDILSWIKAQSDKFPVELEEISFEKIFADVIENVKLTADNKNISINYSIADNINIHADKNMMTAIVRNLVNNAIKFTNKGGCININAASSPSGIIVTVSDNGVGIEPERMKRLFDISQTQTTLGTNNEKGTGLGLLICKELVEKHGGKIWVESKLGNGTTFKFSIPISNQKE